MKSISVNINTENTNVIMGQEVHTIWGEPVISDVIHVNVSCDSATLARDLKILCDGGYEIRKIRGVDQFPMTVHVETVVLMSRVQK